MHSNQAQRNIHYSTDNNIDKCLFHKLY